MTEQEQKEYQTARELAEKAGFTYIAYLDGSTLNLMEEVRAMCAANTCGKYGANWACPPGCGSLEECRDRAEKYRWGILVQTVGEIEDSLDFEGMQEAEAEHKRAFLEAANGLREIFPGLLPLGTGCCTLCRECTYPSEPCRFPDKRVSSMESYGILVSELCKKNGMSYYYGPGKIAYTACFLLG